MIIPISKIIQLEDASQAEAFNAMFSIITYFAIFGMFIALIIFIFSQGRKI